LAQTQYYFAKMPLLVEISLVVIMAWMIAGWLLPEQQREGMNKAQAPHGVAMTLPDMAALLAAPLFGKLPDRTNQAKKPKPVPVIRSRMAVKLLGTVVAGKDSAAIVKLGTEPTETVFFVGDTVQPGAVLKEVQAAWVVIDHNGTLERISLDKNSPLMQASPPARLAPAPQTRQVILPQRHHGF